MADPVKEDPKPTPQRAATVDSEEDLAAVEDPAAERGERIATGKQIARGGNTDGKVPGASKDS